MHSKLVQIALGLSYDPAEAHMLQERHQIELPLAELLLGLLVKANAPQALLFGQFAPPSIAAAPQQVDEAVLELEGQRPPATQTGRHLFLFVEDIGPQLGRGRPSVFSQLELLSPDYRNVGRLLCVILLLRLESEHRLNKLSI